MKLKNHWEDGDVSVGKGSGRRLPVWRGLTPRWGGLQLASR